MTEGYVKFNCDWKQEQISISELVLSQMDESRKLLFGLGLVGIYPDGIGYGNISVRINGLSFLITGTATGQFAQLDPQHYALVEGFDFAGNFISCSGLTKASAESLTHAAVYEILPETGAVVHVHSLELWEKYLNVLPTTSPEVEYGTPEMASAIQNCISESTGNIIVMGGHREGILAFGHTLAEATSAILTIYNQ